MSAMPKEYVEKRFAMTKDAPGYSELKNVIGVWDDHDMGANNSDRLFEFKH